MRIPLLAASVLAAALLGACSSPVPGEPGPGQNGPEQTTEQTRTTEPTTSAAAPSDTPLTSVDPCDLLPSAAASSLGITAEGKPGTQGGARYCSWRVRKDSIADSYTVDVTVWESLGIDKAVSDRAVRPLKVNSRDAVEGIGAGATSCFIALEVTESSRVDVGATGADADGLCPVAQDLAELVEPELP